MKAQTRLIQTAICGIILFLLTAIFTDQVCAQTAPAPNPGGAAGAAPADNSGGVDAGNLDKLLDIAEKGDVSQLSQVNVAGKMGSAAFDAPVSSVERQASTVGQSPAAVFVITNEMIRRSGARSIPEALRMAPGIEVAQITSSKWGISIRGFNNAFADKLLVMIDGRSVYNQTFGGVYWDTIDTLLEDIDHIEVIRGPGGTLWGANAVNGIISIVTKSAKDTHGAYVMAGGGTNERNTEGVRYGGQIGDGFSYRVYGKQFDRGGGGILPPTSSYDAPSPRNFDAFDQQRAGFRTDWDLDKNNSNHLTIQGDAYNGKTGARSKITSVPLHFNVAVFGDEPVSGQNVLMRYSHIIDERSDWALQMYYDSYKRDALLLSEAANTLDIDFQHRFPLSQREELIWGLGFRQVHDNLLGTDPFTLQYDPSEQTTHLASVFFQDEIEVVKDRFKFIVGSKFEDDTLSEFDIQPSVRVLWTPSDRRTMWAAISRAVRSPTRDNTALYSTRALKPDVPGNKDFQRVLGNPDVFNEHVIAYELGYRVRATKKFSWDLAAFFDDYDNLIDLSKIRNSYTENVPPPPHQVTGTYSFNNAGFVRTYGAELACNYDVSERWRLYGQYTLFLHDWITVDFMGKANGMNPSDQVYIWSSWNLTPNLDFDLMARYVENLWSLTIPIDSYITMDARLAWRPRKHLELSIVGQNLLQAQHQEFQLESKVHGGDYNERTSVERAVYGTLTWRY